MLINGIDLSSLGVQLYDRILTSNKIDTTQDWLEGDIQPTYIRQQDTFKDIVLKFLVTEKDEDDAFIIMSKITMLLKKATVKFDDIDLVFDVTINGKTSQERLKNGNFILTVPLLSDYAKGEVEVYTTDSRATDYFNLNVLYYMKGNVLLSSEKVPIRASQFDSLVTTFEDLGIDLNKYQPQYYNPGVTSNFIGKEITYENLYSLQTLVINYAPTVYSKEVEYFINENGFYQPVVTSIITFTKEQIDAARTIGQIIDLTYNKPNGYNARTNYIGELTFDNFNSFSPLYVYFDEIENERTKEIDVNYYIENDNGGYSLEQTQKVVVSEGNIVDGTFLKDIFNVNAYKPEKYYDNGVCDEQDMTEAVTFDSLEDEYNVRYNRSENLILVEYYLGEYPNWSRITTSTYKIKYNTALDHAADIIDAVGIEIDKYKTDLYESGLVRNGSSITDFDSLINIGVIQVYYTPKNYTLRVSYIQEETPLGYKDYQINDYMFLNEPQLSEIIDINAMRADGYIFSPEMSYDGEVTLSALLAASPITITYVPVEQVRTKSILVRYKQELSSAYSTINTSIITIEESEVGGGIRLSDLINLNQYKPEYYNNGIIDGYSSSTVVLFDEIQGTYDVLYLAESYNTQVRYYTDEISNQNWIGSTSLVYKVIDFTTTTTLIDLGLDVNLFKPNYCGDGEVQYTGPVNFGALRNLDSIDIIYTAESEPEDPDQIDYPHRILFLQHNDMGNYESNFPNWTLNHAYINTGVTVSDMSKLSVLCDTIRVFDTEPLYNVNVGDAYLFGSITPNGSYYIKYVNNTSYKPDSQLTGINTFNVAAGLGTPELVVEETSSEGFSKNTGILASSRDGYSYATLTYTNLVQSNSAQMNVPLYLFACNQNGYYRDGIAGVGIKSCKIYYDDVLIRDYVPVAFYDKIGDKVAPSNCLYDKVSQTFFEDGRGLNSFNIMDDEDYPDTNPAHQIGCVYVNYYQGETLFNSATIWFRGDEFIDKYDPYEKFFVDYYQPQYYGSGVIEGLPEDITFNNLKNRIISVRYPSTGYRITVNYWKDDKTSDDNLLGTEVITLTEQSFKQVPTFGQIVDIQKYKPDGYKANYDYPESKVTLQRLLNHSPYDIVYTYVESPKQYTTQITYLRKRFGVDVLDPEQTYENLGSIELTLDETQFADGVYIENFINFDEMYPTSPIQGKPFYGNGQPFEWYLEDEMLTTPDDLKEEYKVSYEPVKQYIDINYYTDEVDEENLIASTTWGIQIDNWPDNEQFTIVDELPNSYIDKYKPVICGGGRINQSSTVYTFETLVAAGHIDIIYDTLEEPHDPESTMFPSKVIWYTAESVHPLWMKQYPLGLATQTYSSYHTPQWDYGFGAMIPYLDLGYTPKEIGRLRIETKAYSNMDGLSIPANRYGAQSDSYSYFLGYYGALTRYQVSSHLGLDGYQGIINEFLRDPNRGGITGSYSPTTSGWFAFKGHTPVGSFFVYTNPYPQKFDGHPSYNLNSHAFNPGFDAESVREMVGGFRRGWFGIAGDNWEPINIYKDYVSKWKTAEKYGFYEDGTPNYTWGDQAWNLVNKWTVVATPESSNENWRVDPELHYLPAVAFNPITMTIDAYNNYQEYYDYKTSNHPYYMNIVNEDHDIFTERCKPKGSISAFLSTNPDNGQVNLLPFNESTYPAVGMGLVGGGAGLQQVALGNPWDKSWTGSVTYTEQRITGTMDDGTPIYTNVTLTRNINYAQNIYDVFPLPFRTMIWYIKIWDRDKLVRNLIPVAEGDQVYDYTAAHNGMFDTVTETFFYNQNNGGSYVTPIYDGYTVIGTKEKVINPTDVFPLRVDNDPTIWGNIVVNYYDENNNFLGNQYVEIPVHYTEANTTIGEICHANEFKPTEFHHDGMMDVDLDFDNPTDATLEAIYRQGSINVYYKLITFTKTVVYYQGNTRVGSKDLFYTIQDIKDAESLEDLGIDVDLYASEDYKPGRIYFNEKVIADDDIKTFIDASSPIVVYDEYTKEEKPELLYLNYYRGGAYDNTLITPNEDPNYLDCDLDAVVLNPNGAIKYANHYHSALYEDEKQDYFIAYQVDVKANYVPVHKGPARRYNTLAIIVDKGRYTVIEERAGWGRLKEYPRGWIMLSYTEPVAGPGENPDYETPGLDQVTVPFATSITITKMTIDRLWCYSPELVSWIKAEELSFDQSGRLYNGLANKVIHLDKLDWNNIDSLDDMEVYPQAYKLKYHDYSDYTYDGAYTEAAFSDIHSIDFVYPETIYAYNCIYYKDGKLRTDEITRESFSCSISDWNPDWDTFIATSWQYDEDENEINPTLYRDTELRLTWDYFGISANKYKPTTGNYNDGMFLWNPRSYDDNVAFTFEEIVTTGKQEIIYLPTYTDYKAEFNANWVNLPVNIKDFYIATDPVLAPGMWDIEFKYQPFDGKYFKTVYSWSSIHSEGEVTVSSHLFEMQTEKENRNGLSSRDRQIGVGIVPRNGSENEPGSGYLLNSARITPITATGEDKYAYYTIGNLSNKRNTSAVYTYGNDISKWKYGKYEAITGADNNGIQSHETITETLNTNQGRFHVWAQGRTETPVSYTSTQLRVGAGGTTAATEGHKSGRYHLFNCVWYYIKVWHNYYLEHYFIPLPKGTWLSDGRQMPYDGFFDVITNTIAEPDMRLVNGYTARGLRPEDDHSSSSPQYYWDVQEQQSIYPTIYKLGDPVTGTTVDFFDRWDYDYDDIYYVVKTTETIPGYKHPDSLSEVIVNSYYGGTIMPVTKVTSDSTNRVQGTWYFNGLAWVQADKCEILPANEYPMTALEKTVAIKTDTDVTGPYQGYYDPFDELTWSGMNYNSETIDNIYYSCKDEFYWDGKRWIKIDSTSDFIEENNNTYIVAVDYLNVYKYPIKNDVYRTSRLQSGDRVQGIAQLVRNNHWVKIIVGADERWINTDNTVTVLE